MIAINPENSFLNIDELALLNFKSIGHNVKVSRFARFYGSNHISLGSNVRIDDFCVISTSCKSSIANNVHISPACLITSQEGFEIGDNVTISSGVRIYGQSDDFKNSKITNPTGDQSFRNVFYKRMIIPDFTAIGTGSTILPKAKLSVGVAIGAMSLLNSVTMPWGIYYGSPAKLQGFRAVEQELE